MEQSLEHHQNNLESSASLIDTSIDSLLNLSAILDKSGLSLTNYSKREQISDAQLLAIRNVMFNYFASYDFLCDHGIVMNEDLILNRYMIFYQRSPLDFSSHFTCDRDAYLTEFAGTHCILPAAHFTSSTLGEYDAITIACQISKIHNTYIFVHYPVQELYELFADQEMLQSCRIAFYYNEELLLSNAPELTEAYEELSVRSSSAVNLEIRLQLPHSYLDQDLSAMKHLVGIFLTVVILACVLWICLFAFHMNKPFTRASKALYNTGHIQEGNHYLSSSDFLVTAIQQLGSKLSDLNQIIEDQKERSRTHILEKAMNRGLFTEDDRSAFAEAFPNFPHNWQIALLQYIPEDASIEADEIQASLYQYFEQKLPQVICHPFSQDSLLVIFPVTHESTPAQELMLLCNYYDAQYPVSLSYTLGQVYDHPSFLSDAFQQIEYDSMLLQQGSAQSPQGKFSSLTIQHLLTIYHALQYGDDSTANAALSTGSASFLANNDRHAAKFSYQMLSSMLLQLQLENSSLSDLPIPRLRNGDIHKLFLEDYPRYFHQISLRLARQRMDQAQNLERDILDYIEQNFSDHQLSINAVTNHFQISAPTLQKRMNACTGKTFSAYVEEVRMKKARQALLNSNLTVQEIAESVGYTNANSFYKAYRRSFGESPRSTRQSLDF